MGHYRTNVRDIEFCLFEVFRCQEIMGTPPFDDLDERTARAMLAATARVASGVVADSFVEGDRTPPTWDRDSGGVRVPGAIHKAYAALRDVGVDRFYLGPNLGGLAAPPSLRWAISELAVGASPAAFLYATSIGGATELEQLGTPEQRKLALLMVERGWTATMVLTEPDAGSDVAAQRTRAVRQPDGSWHLTGVKRFITGGDHDLAENIVHFVLARADGQPAGTKGLSLFVVPKYLVDLETGELGQANGIAVTKVEEKMGLKASATCELSLGAHHPTTGWLLGDVHDGMRQMFRLIETARMMVGAKAISTLSTGYLNALAYARTRVQGVDLAEAMRPDGQRVTIVHHPDVRRMLVTQKAYVEGLRALLLFTGTWQDQIVLGGHDGAADVNGLLVPIVKGFGAERCYQLLALSLQVHGGSGYLRDLPLEQYIRDAKVDTLYEGTTGIQGMDLFFRKIFRNERRGLDLLMTRMRQFCGVRGDRDPVAAERKLLAIAVDEVERMVDSMLDTLAGAQRKPRMLYQVGLNTTRLLMALGDLLVGWLLLWQADVAHRALAATTPRQNWDFYLGKIVSARFFAQTVLPTLTAERVAAETVGASIMDLPETAL